MVVWHQFFLLTNAAKLSVWVLSNVIFWVLSQLFFYWISGQNSSKNIFVIYFSSEEFIKNSHLLKNKLSVKKSRWPCKNSRIILIWILLGKAAGFVFCYKGPSLYYARVFWGFLNHPPTYLRTFPLSKVKENCHFQDHPPTPMSLRNIKMALNPWYKTESLFWQNYKGHY